MGDPYSNVRTFAAATVAEVKSRVSGSDPLPAGEPDRRLRICGSCPHSSGGICQICHCVIAVKVHYRTQDCPQGRWG